MPATLTTDQVWREVEKEFFAVLGAVTARGEPRTVGIGYVVRDRRLYIASDRSAWKVRHIRGNPNVSLTVTIPKRLPFLPWIKIPAATITFQGEAVVHGLDEVPEEIPRTLLKDLKMDPAEMAETCILEVRPRGRFLTYGVGVSLSTMRVPEEATGQAPV
jgi:predicted pyridoxine 5'-phosphate oxidase superfamily flavin-nucleotide-binding protein